MGFGDTIEADLVVAGAGYAGTNAVYAACSYLPKGAKIAWVEPRLQIGGQWVDQYDYVRLHQPHETYSICGRGWNRGWHWSHLATKKEILEYFEESIAEITEKTGVEVVRVFGYKMTGYKADAVGGVVKVQADAVNGSGESLVISAQRLIKALGYDVPIKHPIKFSAVDQVVSTCPVDLLNPELMRQLKSSSKPVIVLGSGKTALDTMNLLAKENGVSSRVHCVCGNGTLFINRDKAFPTAFFERNMIGRNTFIDWLREAGLKYNGSNTQEVLRYLVKAGVLHTPIEGSTGFVLGICSKKEIQTAQKALTPASEKVMKGHLVDIIEKQGKVLMKIRSLDGKTIYEKPIPVGSFIINCTDHLSYSLATWDPIISDDGLVLSPQWVMGFSGPSAAFCTHMYYLGLLQDVWRDMPRLQLDLKDKATFGLTLGILRTFSLAGMASLLPKKLVRELNPAPKVYPLHRLLGAAIRMRLAQVSLMRHLPNVIPGRFTDHCGGDIDAPQVLGGNIGVKRSKKENQSERNVGVGARL